MIPTDICGKRFLKPQGRGGGKTKAGAAGATAVYPDANGPGGWGMDAEIEDVVDQFHIENIHVLRGFGQKFIQ